MPTNPTTAKFGFDHSSLGKDGLIELLIENGKQCDPKDLKYSHLLAVEKMFAQQRLDAGEAPTEYLRADFNVERFTVPQLRQVLAQHNIDYGSCNVRKSVLADLFLGNIDYIRSNAIAQGLRPETPITQDVHAKACSPCVGPNNVVSAISQSTTTKPEPRPKPSGICSNRVKLYEHANHLNQASATQSNIKSLNEHAPSVTYMPNITGNNSARFISSFPLQTLSTNEEVKPTEKFVIESNHHTAHHEKGSMLPGSGFAEAPEALLDLNPVSPAATTPNKTVIQQAIVAWEQPNKPIITAGLQKVVELQIEQGYCRAAELIQDGYVNQAIETIGFLLISLLPHHNSTPSGTSS